MAISSLTYTSDYDIIFPALSDEYAAAIGHVAANWSAVEGACKHLIKSLLALNGPAGEAVTAELNSLAGLNLATTLVALTGEDRWVCEWDQIGTEYDTLRIHRNETIHSEWSVTLGVLIRSRSKARGKLNLRFDIVKTDDLAAVAAECRALSIKIIEFSTELLRGGARDLILAQFPPGLVRDQPAMRHFLARDQSPKPKKTKKLSSAQKRALREKDAPSG